MEEQKDKQNHKIHIAVENFGPIEKAEIDLRPLTIFVGESNTGKTYLSALVYALYQNFEGISRFPWQYHAGSLLSITYRSRSYLHQRRAELDEEVLETLEKLNSLERPFKYSDLPERIRLRLESNLNKSEPIQKELQRCFDLTDFANLIRMPGGLFNELKISLKVYEENQKLWNFDMFHSGQNSMAEGSVNTDIILKSTENQNEQDTYDFDDLVSLLRNSRLRETKSYYLPAARSGIIESHGLIVSSVIDRVTRIGYESLPEMPTFSGMTADFIKLIINYKEHRKSYPEIIEIAEALEEEILQGRIIVQQNIATEHTQFVYHPKMSGLRLGMSSTSSMVSELAPLVMLLRGIVKPGDLLIIEEPEAHLHPRAQTKMAITLARLVNAGVRLIITTHSNWLLEQISNIVREGEVAKLEKNIEQKEWLTKEDVGAWWFHKDQPVKEVIFKEIAGIEPEDYGEVAEELYNRSVDLRNLLMKKMGDNKVE